MFLAHEKVPATNNRAERQLRPAVIRHKLSCGNRTPRGAEAFERMASAVEAEGFRPNKDVRFSITSRQRCPWAWSPYRCAEQVPG